MAGWTDISASRKDADSPIDEDLFSDLDDNTTYNHERAIRSGTHATGVRTCIARGKTAWSFATGEYVIVLIEFDTALDGDPNFLAAPTVIMTLEEDPAGSDEWLGEQPSVYLEETTVTASQCSGTVQFTPSSSLTVQGWIHWIAIGTVMAGE